LSFLVPFLTIDKVLTFYSITFDLEGIYMYSLYKELF